MPEQVRSFGSYLAGFPAQGGGLVGRRHGVDLQERPHRSQEALVPQEPRGHGALQPRTISLRYISMYAPTNSSLFGYLHMDCRHALGKGETVKPLSKSNSLRPTMMGCLIRKRSAE